jgi:hypothetical protein
VVGERTDGITFKAKIDVLESMGSEFYAYFVVEAERVSSRELEELASDAGAADLPTQEGSQITARLDAASSVKQGQETELWFNTEHIHLFDPESGQTLLGSNGAGAARATGASGVGGAPGATGTSGAGGPGATGATGATGAPGTSCTGGAPAP